MLLPVLALSQASEGVCEKLPRVSAAKNDTLTGGGLAQLRLNGSAEIGWGLRGQVRQGFAVTGGRILDGINVTAGQVPIQLERLSQLRGRSFVLAIPRE